MIIDDELTAAFNAKPKIDINKIKTMSPGQLDAIKTYGTGAENLLANKDFALFVHHFKFDIANELADITGHMPEDNCKRVALAHNLAGIDRFVASLQRAVYYKNRAVSIQNAPTE